MSVISIKCPNCGGELVFEPSSQSYACPYCNSTFTQEQLDQMLGENAGGGSSDEEQAAAGAEKDREGSEPGGADGQEECVYYSCPSCGAQIVTDSTTAATQCYYCHNPVVLEGRISGSFLPDKIIPFKISRKEAVDQFLKFVGKKRYVPKDFFSEQQIEKMTGVYYPYWLYDTTVNGSLSASGVKTRMWRVGDTEYTETSIYDVRRAGVINIDHIFRNALKKTSGELVEHVQPYRMDGMKDFSMGYLSGFMAEKRDMEKKEFQEGLRKEAGKYARQLLEGSASEYASLKVKDANYEPVSEQYTYALLPVWVLTYRTLSGSFYYYAMNGQTGEVAGELPVEKTKLLIHSVILGLVIMLAAFAIGYFFV